MLSQNPYTLSKKNRIKKKNHFQLVFDKGQRIENGLVRVYFFPKTEHAGGVAFVAGKKIGKAVFRSECKRRLRELYRLNQHRISPQFEMILMAKKSLMKYSYSQANKWFLILLKDHALLNTHGEAPSL